MFFFYFQGTNHRAVKTLPLQVKIHKSTIKNYGIIAVEKIPKNTVFGPYEGIDVNPTDLVKTNKFRMGGYAWEVS